MTLVTNTSDFGATKTYEEIRPFLLALIKELVDVVNGKLQLQTNVQVSISDVTFSVANTDTQVAHTLARVPIGFIVLGANAAMTVYTGTRAANTSVIFLRSSATGTAKVCVL